MIFWMPFEGLQPERQVEKCVTRTSLTISNGLYSAMLDSVEKHQQELHIVHRIELMKSRLVCRLALRTRLLKQQETAD